MDDLISRADAIDALNKLGESTYEVNYGVVDCDDAINAIAALPPTEPKRGKWIDNGEAFICSECRSGYKEQPTLMGKPMFEFCPMCGAKMEVDHESN